MREFIKYRVKFPLKKVLLYLQLFSRVIFHFKGVEGLGIYSVNIQEHISRGNNVDY